MNLFPKNSSGQRVDTEDLKREGWRRFGILAVSVSDRRLTRDERVFVRVIGERLYGTSEPKPKGGDDR